MSGYFTLMMSILRLGDLLLVLDSISHSYKHRFVLNGISLAIAPGQILCITGPSGCGKTTLLRIAAGLMASSAGIVTNNFACTAYVFQEPRLLPWQTTQDNLSIGLKAQGVTKEERARASRQLAKQLGLEHALDLYPHQLSGGMQQRVALGRALAIAPDLLLLDEPFSGLDVGRRRELQDMLLELLSTASSKMRGDRPLAACLVSHDLAEAVRLGDRIIVMSPSPSRIVHQWHSQRPPADRDDAYVYREVSQLLALPHVNRCFGLKNSHARPDVMRF